MPQTSWSARAALAPIAARLPAYAGYGGVVIKGSQAESGSVSGFRSVSAARLCLSYRDHLKVSINIRSAPLLTSLL